MSERAAQRRAAWETLIGLAGVLAATQVAGSSMLATISASALFTIGVAAFAHAGAMLVKALRRATPTRSPPAWVLDGGANHIAVAAAGRAD